MKRKTKKRVLPGTWFYGVGAFAVGLLALAGCSTDEPGGPDGGELTAVEFTAGINTATGPAAASVPGTRTTDGGDAWADGDKVGIFMISAGGTLGADILTVGGVTADNIGYDVSPGSPASSARFTPADRAQTICYPQDGSPVDFIAYYPFDDYAGAITADYKFPFSIVNQISEEERNKLDILYAKTPFVEKSKTAVDLQFNHVLSKVTFNILLGEGMEGLSGDDITMATFYDMPHTCRFDLNTGMPEGISGDFFPALKTSGTPGYDAVFTSLLIPQPQDNQATYPGIRDFHSRTAEFTIGGEKFIWKIPDDVPFLAGEHYIYPVTIQRGVVQVGERQIADWKQNDHGTGDALPIGINTPDDLVAFSAAWNAATTTAARQAVIDDCGQNGTIYLWADLDMSSVANFTPIGADFDYHFTGTFDGQGHTIKNLTVNRGSGDYAGLFGWIGSGSHITGIKLEDCHIQGGSNVGGIAGRNYGTVYSCEITGGTITAISSYSGGIVGYNYGTYAQIDNCTVSGNPQIQADSYSGGIAGFNSDGTISTCEITGGDITATEDYSGGIVGYNFGTSARIENCTVSGNPQIQSGDFSGGIAGFNSNGTVSNCEITGGTITAIKDYSDGIVGYHNGTSAKIENCTVSGNPEIKSTYHFAGGITGCNDTGVINGCKITGGSVRATEDYSGGITGWNGGTIVGSISSPLIITGNISFTGFVAGRNNTNSTISDTYYCRIAGMSINNAVGTNNCTVTGGDQFDKADIKQTDNFFTTGPVGSTPIDLMNSALQAAGSSYRWRAGTAASDWWPVAYEQ